MSEAPSSIPLRIRLSSGSSLEVSVSGDGSTVRNVMEQLEPLLDCPPERQRLIHKGRILEPNKTLAEYGIISNATLYAVVTGAAKATAKKPSAAATTTPTSAGSTTATATTSQASAPVQASAQPASAQPDASTTASPGLDPLMASLMQNLRSSNAAAPNVDSSGSNPWGSSSSTPTAGSNNASNNLLQGLLDNPEVMANIMQAQLESNPQLRELAQQNPQVRHVLQDPALLAQAARMMRDPQAMQHMLRHQDLALSQLENMPGGFAALRNMYETVQEPMENSMMYGESAGNSDGQPRTSSGDAGATGTAMPNPWSSTPTTTQPPRRNNNSNLTVPPPPPMNFSSLLGSGGAGANTNPWAATSSSQQQPPANANPLANPWGMPSGMPPPPPPEQMQAMTEMLTNNPALLQMMEQTFEQNPDMFVQMIAQQNPMMAEQFRQHPEQARQFVRTMMNPTVMRQMLQLQQAMSGAGIGGSGTGTGAGTAGTGTSPTMNPWLPSLPGASSGAGASTASPMMNPWLSALQGAGANPLGSAAPPPPRRPDASHLTQERLQVQLRSLRDMGFDDEARNLAALQANHGNVNRAIDFLLSEPAATTTTSSSTTPAAASAPEATTTTPPPSDSGAQEEEEERPDESSPKDATDKKND